MSDVFRTEVKAPNGWVYLHYTTSKFPNRILSVYINKNWPAYLECDTVAEKVLFEP